MRVLRAESTAPSVAAELQTCSHPCACWPQGSRRGPLVPPAAGERRLARPGKNRSNLWILWKRQVSYSLFLWITPPRALWRPLSVASIWRTRGDEEIPPPTLICAVQRPIRTVYRLFHHRCVSESEDRHAVVARIDRRSTRFPHSARSCGGCFHNLVESSRWTHLLRAGESCKTAAGGGVAFPQCGKPCG